MKFGFVSPVDKALFDRTHGAWSQQLAENPANTSSTYYGAGLDYCRRVVSGEKVFADGGGCLCAVVEEGRDTATALLIVSHAKAQSDEPFLKMLDVYVQPNLNLANAEPNYPELAWIAATAIVGCLGLTYKDFPSRQLKVHTAFPLDRDFMVSLMAVFFTQKDWAENYEVNMHGSWLVLDKKVGTNGSHVRAV